MKNKHFFCKTISLIVVVLALTFSNNVNATPTNSILLSSDTVTLSTSSIALTGSGWWTSGWWSKSKCKRCHRKHRGSCKNNNDSDNKCRKCHRKHRYGSKCGKKPPTDSIPLDGGLSILALGAAAFGIRKLRGKKNNKS